MDLRNFRSEALHDLSRGAGFTDDAVVDLEIVSAVNRNLGLSGFHLAFDAGKTKFRAAHNRNDARHLHGQGHGRIFVVAVNNDFIIFDLNFQGSRNLRQIQMFSNFRTNLCRITINT